MKSVIIFENLCLPVNNHSCLPIYYNAWLNSTKETFLFTKHANSSSLGFTTDAVYLERSTKVYERWRWYEQNLVCKSSHLVEYAPLFMLFSKLHLTEYLIKEDSCQYWTLSQTKFVTSEIKMQGILQGLRIRTVCIWC